MAAGDLLKAGVLDLDRRRAPGIAATAAGRPDLVEHRLQRRSDLVPMPEISGKRSLGADGLARAIGLHRTIVLPARHAVIIAPRLAEVPAQKRQRLLAQIETGVDAECLHFG